MEIDSKIHEIKDDPYKPAKEWKERTWGKVVGYFCSYAPEEIIYASGALPVRIIGRNKAATLSGAHLQNYCCSLARTSLDMALEGDFDFLDGTVFVHTCDTMQRLSDIWRLNAGAGAHFDVVLPTFLGGKNAYEYLRSELSSFKKSFENEFGKISDDDLRRSIDVYNRNRQLLEELYSLRIDRPEVLSSEKLYMIVTSSSLMEKNEHNKLLESLLSELKASSSSGDSGGGKSVARIFGIGSVMEEWDFLRILKEAGGTFVDDDFCNGRRYFDGLIQQTDDPIEGIARRISERAICPCKHTNTYARADDILERVMDSRAEGVIFFQFKFCEPHAFDYVALKEALDKASIPSMLIEIEQGSVSLEQLRTRIEAFIETIRG